MRVLHSGICGGLQGVSGPASASYAGADQARTRRQLLPLRDLCRNQGRYSAGGRNERSLIMDYKWPNPEQRSLIGKRISRVDGPVKVSGKAKYTYDLHPAGMLYGKVVRSAHAHCKITSIDTSAAEAVPGVKAVHIVQGPGSEISWAGDDLVVIAAVDEPTANDAARLVKVVYEPLPHWVNDFDSPTNVPADNGPL